MDIKLVRITDANKDNYKSLNITKEQREYVDSFSKSYSLVTKNKDPLVKYILKGIKYKDTPVGYVLLRFNKKPYKYTTEDYYPGALLNRILIDKKAQGIGIGRQVIQYSIDYAKKEGYSKLHATCVPGKHSIINHIKGSGWKKTGRIIDDEIELIYLMN